MAGFASFGMPMGNDNSAAAQKARKEALARIALAKKNGYKGSGFIGGKSGPIMESTSIGDFINRLARNYTVDVGDAVSRTVQDTFLGGRGKSNVLDYSLVEPDSGFSFLDSLIKYNPTNLLVGNLLNNSDFSQMLAPGDIIPVEKAASLGLKGAKIAAPSILKGIKGAAGRTSADALSAASGGLLRGSPVRAARSAPEPDEFDKIINAAKAKDPTLGDVTPEGTAAPVFRSELDWDENMSVNYEAAVNKITDDLMRLQKGALGEDPTLIKPLIDDSIAALDSEIGNLTMSKYNHNDLEDFLGKIAAPDDYTVADATLAKRADDFINEVDTESVLWGADPEAWLLDTQFNMDAAAKKAVKSGTARLERQGPEDLLSNPGGPAPSSNNPRAPRGKFEGMPKDPMTGNYMDQPNERRFASGGSVLARAESQSLSFEAANKATQTAITRLERMLKRPLNAWERQIIRSKAKESGPEFYTAYQEFASHPDNYDRIVKVAAENETKIKMLDDEIASAAARKKAKKPIEQLKTQEIIRQNAEFAQAHSPGKGLKDNPEGILTGKTSAVEGIQITSKKANDLDNQATQRYDKLFKSGDPIINVEFPDGKPDSWAKIVDWGIKNSDKYKRYLSMPDGLNQMRYDLYLTHLI